MMHFVAAEASGGKVNIHTNMLGAAQPGAVSFSIAICNQFLQYSKSLFLLNK